MEEKGSQAVQFIRCRFLKLYPSAIISLAYNPQSQQLAVGRENGSLQLYDTRSMSCFYELSGYKKEAVPLCKLHWFEDRLLMTSFSGYVIEWDLKECCAKRNLMVDGSGIWDSSLISNSLLVACEDGAIRLVNLENQKEFYTSYISVPQQSRAIAICGSSLSEDSLIIYSGHSDGTLARWDSMKSKTATSLMKGSAAAITAITVIRKYQAREFIAGGDSKGNLTIWDCKNSVRLISFQTHRAAILTIKENEGIIFASGSDSLITCFAESQAQRWKIQNSERAQSHDVLALQILDDSTLVSGGITTDLCVHSLSSSHSFHQSYGNHNKDKHYRHIVGLSSFSKVKHSKSQSNITFVCVNKTTSLELFKLDDNYTHEFLGSFKFKGSQNISCFALQALSSSQVLIAVSEITSLRVLSYNGTLKEAEVIYEEKVPNLIRNLCFGKHYLYALDCAEQLSLYKVSLSLSVTKQKQSSLKKEELGSQLLLSAQFSPDQRYLCLLYEQNKLSVNLTSKSSNFMLDLPVVKNNSALCSSFMSQNVLLITYSNNQIITVDLAAKGLLEWSIHYSFSLPRTLLTWYNKLKGSCPLNSHRAIFYSHNGYLAVNLKQPPPKVAKFVRHQLAYKDKSVKQDEEEQWFAALESMEKSVITKEKSGQLKPFEINTQNFGILGMEQLSDSQILIYECDFSKMVKDFPKTLRLKKYGY